MLLGLHQLLSWVIAPKDILLSVQSGPALSGSHSSTFICTQLFPLTVDELFMFLLSKASPTTYCTQSHPLTYSKTSLHQFLPLPLLHHYHWHAMIYLKEIDLMPLFSHHPIFLFPLQQNS